MIALFDADILVYRGGFAAERNQWFLSVKRGDPEVFAYKREAQARLDELLPGIHSRVEGEDYQLWSERYLEPIENAYHNVNEIVRKALEEIQVNEFDARFFLSGPRNFRYDVAKTRPYKGNRDKKHTPTYEEDIRKYIRGKWETVVAENVEADDLMGQEQTRIGPTDSVIVSIDKDLDMIPGLKYNFMHEILYEVSEEQAWRNFCIQLLTGDSTDNIPGLPRVGKAKAEKMLDGLEKDEWLEECARQYASKSGREDWFDFLTEQAQLIWILRDDNMFEVPPEFKELGGGEATEIPTDMY